jgi:hypothetical protein
MTSPARADTLISPLLLALRDCLCDQLRSSVAGPVCRCAVVHTQALPVMDGCECRCAERDVDTELVGRGDASVRMVRLDPDLALVGGPGPCPTGWQALISMVTYRCVPTPEADELLDPQTLTDTTLELNSDLAAMLRVLQCCPELADRDVSVDLAQPIGPTGGCAGWELQLRVALPTGPGGC